MGDEDIADIVNVTYARWGIQGVHLVIRPVAIRWGVEERLFPEPPSCWLLDCHDVEADKPRTLVLERVQGFTTMPTAAERLLQGSIRELQRQVARLQDTQRVVKQMASEARTSGEPLDHRHVYNLMHAGTCHSDVYVAELEEMRVILGTLLDTEDRIRHHVYEHGSITHAELSGIMAHQFDRRRTEEGRVLLARVGRVVTALLGRKAYAPVEDEHPGEREIDEVSIVADMGRAANRLRKVSQAPVPPTSARGYHKGWKNAMEAAVAAYRGDETWLI